MEVLNAPSRAVTCIRSSPLSLIGQPIAAPTAASSAMPSSIHSRHSGSARIWSQLARVSADSGLIVALPHNLYQSERRILPGQVGAQAGAVEQCEQPRQALGRLAAAGFADDQLVGMVDGDAVGRGAAARGMDDAADHLAEREGARDCAAGIDGFERLARLRTTTGRH